jgi:hypothetical protein
VNILVGGKFEGGHAHADVIGKSIDICLDLLLSKGLSVEEEVVDTGDSRAQRAWWKT